MAERSAGTTRAAYRTEVLVFGGTGLFLVPWTVLYVVSSDDRAGGLLLAGCAVALLALASYFALQSRRTDVRASERDLPSDVDEVAVHGHAPAMSVWPLVIATAATLLGFGLAFTVWVAIPAGMLLAVGVLGYAREG
jgi:hypothetical protein